ncbi:nitrogenase component 1 [Thermoanaerobacterium sp. RBIITD]|uniref:nitrogenase component 1 n=1 Tax=Thermoanaerobacterium sp. RBIITD TaxID=1550240 RepID=UPI000BBF53C6|nr:nitrogenase component 1 [Thermoanaerobacterium sp. RBIITD]SNX54945.1 nitrogenase molybdenum-cofactor synthesis protein NifE [Thermoanaerobacterium sp. RBIITD]
MSDYLVDERRKHVCIKGWSPLSLPECEKPTIPGIMSERSCAYYGARWVLGQIKDAIHLVHGPVGCAYYGQVIRGKTYRIFSSDLQEKDIIFGGEKKLIEAILNAVRLFPEAKAVFVYTTCSVSLIGDDVNSVCKNAELVVKRPVIWVNCPGFCGVSQSEGHRIAYDILMERFVGTKVLESPTSYDINIIGEYDVKGDLQIIKTLLEKIGVRVLCTFTGDASIDKMSYSHYAKLNVLHCRKTGFYFAERMEKKYGIPSMKVSFFGMKQTSEALRKIAVFFGLEERAEAVIEEEIEKVRRRIGKLYKRIEEKSVAMYFGGSRMGTMVKAFEDLGMEVIITGSQFGRREDYEEAAKNVSDGTLIIDDANDMEIEEMLTIYKPDLFVGGTKEKYLSHKLGVPFLVFPQNTSPYAGFKGFCNFAEDVYKAIYNPVWKFVFGKRKENKIIKIAVASKDGIMINEHFGKASQFLIYKLLGDRVSLMELRKTNSGISGECCDGEAKDHLDQIADLLFDCSIVYCGKAGHCAKEKLEERGIKVVMAEGSIEKVLHDLATEAK